MGHKIGKVRIWRQLLRPSRMIETIDKHHVNRRQPVTGDQGVQHVGEAVFVLVSFTVKEQQGPARGLRQPRAINQHFPRILQKVAAQLMAG